MTALTYTMDNMTNDNDMLLDTFNTCTTFADMHLTTPALPKPKAKAKRTTTTTQSASSSEGVVKKENKKEEKRRRGGGGGHIIPETTF